VPTGWLRTVGLANHPVDRRTGRAFEQRAGDVQCPVGAALARFVRDQEREGEGPSLARSWTASISVGVFAVRLATTRILRVAASMCVPLQAEVVLIVAPVVAGVNAAARWPIVVGHWLGFRRRRRRRWLGIKAERVRVVGAYDVAKDGAVGMAVPAREKVFAG
jgi:hypothetical protein